jgi:hypothetical protein
MAKERGMHSKGPWVWQGLHRDGVPVLYACGDPKHRLVKAASEPRLSFEDARLIAAAPEMYHFLSRFTDDDLSYEHMQDWAKAILASIEGGRRFNYEEWVRSALPGG